MKVVRDRRDREGRWGVGDDRERGESKCEENEEKEVYKKTGRMNGRKTKERKGIYIGDKYIDDEIM